MKRNKLYILPLILSLFWGLTSCEDDSSIESAGTGSVSGITLKLSMPSSVASRAVEEPGEEALNENTIKSLDVFVYREGADECLFYQHFAFSPELTGTGEHTAYPGCRTGEIRSEHQPYHLCSSQPYGNHSGCGIISSGTEGAHRPYSGCR